MFILHIKPLTYFFYVLKYISSPKLNWSDFVNKRDEDVILALSSHKYSNQRELANICNCSLGAINKSIQNLLSEGLVDENMRLTDKCKKLLSQNSPKRAILLAAGLGIKKSLFDAEIPKALLEVDGEVLIERLICQLQAVGVYEIHIVVGFAKEKFEYLIDKYGVQLIVNADYLHKNNLNSMALAEKHLDNCYVVPCDLWCKRNPFENKELYSWYMVSDAKDGESSVRVNRKQELSVLPFGVKGDKMIGISYLLKSDAEIIRKRILEMNTDRRYKGAFWEEALYEKDKLLIGPKVVENEDVVEINSIDDLQELDAQVIIPIDEISKVLSAKEDEITNISVLKKGMTNRSFSFAYKNESYILRIPVDDRKEFINYTHEAKNYKAVQNKGIADEVVYLNENTGLKISKYISGTHFCNPHNKKDVEICMKKLRQFHNAELKVDHEFDLFERIEYFESLWNGTRSVYPDYEETKQNILSLKTFIDSLEKGKTLVHIDAVHDNFMIPDNSDDWDKIRLIDWEYAGMQDPHLDIAMFCLYAMYDRNQVDGVISAYFTEGCSNETRLKIYSYIAIGGLIWSNWCEYKIKHGVEFGEYSIKQYRFAKEYYRIVQNELKGKENV